MRRTARTLAAAVSAATAVAIGLISTPGQAAAAAMPTPVGPTVTAAEAPGSVAYLVARYHVTQGEAVRRLELQRVSTQIDRWLRTTYPDLYAGMWLDQASGGVLNIGMVDPTKAASALRNLADRAHVRAVAARWSLRQLESTAQQLDRQLNTDPNPKNRVAEETVDPQSDQVVVFQHAGTQVATAANAGTPRALAATEANPTVRDARVDAAVATQGGRAVVREMVVGDVRANRVSAGPRAQDSPVPGVDPCDPRSCSPPMRGGMRLDVMRTSAAPVNQPPDYNANAWYGECTNGFNMSDSRGWNYVMTAGHCMTGPYKVGVDVTNYTDGTPVSYEVFNFENGPTCGGCDTFPYDYSIEPYRTDTGVNEYDYWAAGYAKNQVVSWCYWGSSTWQGCADGSFSIKGYYTQSQAAKGWIVCATGTGDDNPNFGYITNAGQSPGTRCGEIGDKRGSAGLQTNICSRFGDSGGPLFSELDGMAYGILHGGYSGTGACPLEPNDTEWSDYSPIDFILNHVRNQTIAYENHDYGFYLRTTP